MGYNKYVFIVDSQENRFKRWKLHFYIDIWEMFLVGFTLTLTCYLFCHGFFLMLNRKKKWYFVWRPKL